MPEVTTLRVLLNGIEHSSKLVPTASVEGIIRALDRRFRGASTPDRLVLITEHGNVTSILWRHRCSVSTCTAA